MSDGFGSRLRLDQIRDGQRLDISADDAERNRIAERLGLLALERFDAHVALERAGEVIRARGRLKATVQQRCVATGEPVAAHLDEPFEVMFIAELADQAPADEIELSAADCDVVFHDGSAIDLGSAVADTLALSLDPYPRSAGAEATLREAGVLSEEQAGPFAALAKLKKGLDQPDS